jgi:peptide deformylase
MSIQRIRHFGDPVLTSPASQVVDFDKELRKLVKDLTETMLDAPGAGLAAPQIGVPLRVFVWDVDETLGHLINPTLDLSEEMQEGDEGCLSFPDLLYPTPRSMRAVAKGFTMHGEPVVIEGTELLARALQHETDHLEGILFIDRLSETDRKLAMKEIRESEWFAAIIKKLKDSLAAGANPPGASSIDGFTGTCSAEAARIKKLLDEARSCSIPGAALDIPDAASEIARVNTLLNSPKLKQAVSKMNGLLAEMLKLQSDLEKAKNGTLYDWQKDPPKKSYAEFKGGDRTAALTFSMQQNK